MNHKPQIRGSNQYFKRWIDDNVDRVLIFVSEDGQTMKVPALHLAAVSPVIRSAVCIDLGEVPRVICPEFSFQTLQSFYNLLVTGCSPKGCLTEHANVCKLLVSLGMDIEADMLYFPPKPCQTQELVVTKQIMTIFEDDEHPVKDDNLLPEVPPVMNDASINVNPYLNENMAMALIQEQEDICSFADAFLACDVEVSNSSLSQEAAPSGIEETALLGNINAFTTDTSAASTLNTSDSFTMNTSDSFTMNTSESPVRTVKLPQHGQRAIYVQDQNELLRASTDPYYKVFYDGNDKKMHRCVLCQKVFPKFEMYISHVSTKAHTTFVAKGKPRLNNSSPENNRQNSEGPFPCTICKKVFNKMSAMKSHRRLSHSLAMAYTCNECKVGFSTANGYQRHCDKHAAKKMQLPAVTPNECNGGHN